MRFTIPLLAWLAACASADSAPLTPATLLIVHGPATAGATVGAVFQNQTSSRLSVGDLGCSVDFDILDGDGWRAVTDDPLCPATSRLVDAGDSLAFTIQAPTVAGTYRIRGSAVVADDQSGGQQTLQLGIALLQSAPFVVKAASIRTP